MNRHAKAAGRVLCKRLSLDGDVGWTDVVENFDFSAVDRARLEGWIFLRDLAVS